MNMNDRAEYGTRKLQHYNKWLLDPKRKVEDGPYPGFPEDLKPKRAVKPEIVVKPAAKVKAPAVKTKKRAARAGDGPTKQMLANDIFARLGGDKAAVIAAIQLDLGMSLAGATTYFYNARKA
jgi:hypothetical protein